MNSTTPTTTGSYVRPAVSLRPLRHDDGPLLDQILAGMSAESRFRRFHVPKERLTRRERDWLTAVDERDHLAAIAITEDGEPVGVARIARMPDDTEYGELAIAVVDAWQGRGLGDELLAHLAARASAAGLDALIAFVLNETGLVGSLERRGWKVAEREGPVTAVVVCSADAAAAA
jgi:GNAT superfamily N-acetyltransferase